MFPSEGLQFGLQLKGYCKLVAHFLSGLFLCLLLRVVKLVIMTVLQGSHSHPLMYPCDNVAKDTRKSNWKKFGLFCLDYNMQIQDFDLQQDSAGRMPPPQRCPSGYRLPAPGSYLLHVARQSMTPYNFDTTYKVSAHVFLTAYWLMYASPSMNFLKRQLRLLRLKCHIKSSLKYCESFLDSTIN
jgi:hypothetical protein